MALQLDGTTGISTTGNIIADGTLTVGTFNPSSINATGNVAGANLNTAGQLSVGGNAVVTGDLTVVGNASLSGNIVGDKITNGTTSVEIQTPNGNANITIGGTSNVAVFTTTGLAITGTISANGNITGGNLSGTSLTGSVVSVSGNITGGNINTSGKVSVTGNIDVANVNVTGDIIPSANVTYNLGSTNYRFKDLWLSGNSIQLGDQTISSNTGGVALTGNISGNNVNTPGNVTSGNVYTGNISASGTVTATIVQNANANSRLSFTNFGTFSSNIVLFTENANGNVIVRIGESTTEGPGIFGLFATGTIGAIGNLTSQANIAQLGNASSWVLAKNINSEGVISANGNVTGGNINTGGVISATSNITGGNLNAAGLSLSSNVVSALNSTSNITTSANVQANYLIGTFVGNISGNITAPGSNTQVVFNDGGNAAGSSTFTFNKTSNVVSVTGNIIGNNIAANTQISAAGNILGNAELYIGAGAASTGLTNPIIVAQATGLAYVQVAAKNSANTGSADLVTYADNGTDAAAWTDMGMTGSGFNDTAYTITNANDGYVFVQGNTDGTGGNLVLATGGLGNAADIVFATGGFLDANEKMRFINATGQFWIETTTNATSATSGALKVAGGAGIAGNAYVGGLISATGNITGGNVSGTSITGSVVSASGTVTGGNLATGGTASAGGNITGANILTGGLISATGNITGGNLSGTNIVGTLTTASQTNITSVGTLGSLSVTGNITGGNANINGVVNVTTSVTVDGGAYGNVVTNQFASVFAHGSGPNPRAIFQARAADGIAGLGMQAYSGLNGQIYSNTGFTFTTGATVRDKDFPTGGTTRLTVDSTGLSVTGIVTASGNVTGANILTGGLISATGNITGGNVNTNKVVGTGLTLVSTGNLTLSTTGNIDANNEYINNVPTPQQDGDAVNKLYVDGLVTTGFSFHSAVFAATNTTLATATGGTITYTQPNGAANGVGATLTTTGSFNLIDTANIQTVGTRVLVKNEGNAVFNGIYTWANATAIVRSTDADEYGADSTTALSINDYFFVQSGNVNAGSAYVVDSPSGTITFGTSNISFAQFSSAQVYSGNTSAGISLNGTVFNALVDNVTTAFSSGNIVVKTGAQLTTPNIGAATGTSLSTTGNVTGGNINTGGIVSATGNITASYFLGNGSQLTGIDATSIQNGTSNVRVVSSGGNVAVSVGGTSNVAVYATTGEYVTGLISASGNVTAANYLTGGLISATGNITGGNVLGGANVNATLFTGTAVSVTGNITGGNVLGGANVNATLFTGTTVSVIANVTGGNILTGGAVSATGNATAANYLTGGLISSTGNITSAANIAGANLISSGLVTATGNIVTTANVSGGNVLSSALIQGVTLSASGNVNGANIVTAGSVSATGNVIGANFTTVGLISATGNITSAANVAGGNVIATTLVQGTTVSATGNVIGGNVTTAGQLVSSVVTGTAPLVVSSTTLVPNLYVARANVSDWDAINSVTTGTYYLMMANATSGNIQNSANTNISVNVATGVVTASGYTTSGTVTAATVNAAAIGNSGAAFTGASISAATIGNAAAVVNGATVSITGTVTAASVVGGVMTGSSLSVSGAVTGGAMTGSSLTVSTGAVTLGSIVNANANGVGNIGSSSVYFNTVFGKATTAQYADLAEMYAADAPYAPGTVLDFGGEHEVTLGNSVGSSKIAGVVSTNPAHLMNSVLTAEHPVAVALTGRVPTLVVGTVRKGDMMVSAGNGHAQACATPAIGTVIGKALENFDGQSGVIEVVVGRL